MLGASNVVLDFTQIIVKVQKWHVFHARHVEYNEINKQLAAFWERFVIRHRKKW